MAVALNREYSDGFVANQFESPVLALVLTLVLTLVLAPVLAPV